GAEFPRGKRGDRVVGAVGQPDRHEPTWADAVFGHPMGESVGRRFELCPGHHVRDTREPDEDQRGLVAAFSGQFGQPLAWTEQSLVHISSSRTCEPTKPARAESQRTRWRRLRSRWRPCSAPKRYAERRAVGPPCRAVATRAR